MAKPNYKVNSDSGGEYVDFPNAGGFTRVYVGQIVESGIINGRVNRFDDQFIYFNKPVTPIGSQVVKYGQTEVPVSFNDFNSRITKGLVNFPNAQQMGGGRNKKRHLRKSKKSKRSKQSKQSRRSKKPKSKSRTRRGWSHL
jgi:hypothetical protein